MHCQTIQRTQRNQIAEQRPLCVNPYCWRGGFHCLIGCGRGSVCPLAEPCRQIHGVEMSVALEHLQGLVADHRSHLHDVQSLLEEATGGFMAQVMDTQPRNYGAAAARLKECLSAFRVKSPNTWPLSARGRPRSRAIAREESGTARDSPFWVMGRYAVRLSKSTFVHRRPMSSLRRIPVSIGSDTSLPARGCGRPGTRSSRFSSSPSSRRLRGRPCGGRRTSVQGLREEDVPRPARGVDRVGKHVEFAVDRGAGYHLEALIPVGRQEGASEGRHADAGKRDAAPWLSGAGPHRPSRVLSG